MERRLLEAVASVSTAIEGKEHEVKLALACLLADGHLLIEDLPGMGKTTLAQALSRVLGLAFTRVQFTSDMLPSDLLGASVFVKHEGRFVFHKGPVFTQLLLADEINRSTAKTQSALLEAMAEKQVSIEGKTELLPSPFFVIATQNPSSQFGTFALPESQLDRFLIKISLGYPSFDAERSLLKGETGRQVLEDLPRILDLDILLKVQELVAEVKTSEVLLDYIQALLLYTRNHTELKYGVSPRGGLALVRMSKAWALLQGRDFVIPEDVQAVVMAVFHHRLIHAADTPQAAEAVIEEMCLDVTTV